MPWTFEVLDPAVLPFLDELVQRQQIRLQESTPSTPFPLPNASRATRFASALNLSEQLSLESAAEALYTDYMNDESLTAFTQLDCEDFDETRGNMAD